MKRRVSFGCQVRVNTIPRSKLKQPWLRRPCYFRFESNLNLFNLLAQGSTSKPNLEGLLTTVPVQDDPFFGGFTQVYLFISDELNDKILELPSDLLALVMGNIKGRTGYAGWNQSASGSQNTHTLNSKS